MLGVLLLTVVSPVVVRALMHATGCNVSGDCGFLARFLLSAPFFTGIGLYLAVVTWRRAHMLRLNPWGFAFVLVSYFAVSFMLDTFVAFGFSLEIRRYVALITLIGFLLAGLIGLSCLTPHSPDRNRHPARRTTFVIGGLSLLLILLPQAIQNLAHIPVVGGYAMLLVLPAMLLGGSVVIFFGAYFSSAMLAAFVAALTWWVRSDRASQHDVEHG